MKNLAQASICVAQFTSLALGVSILGVGLPTSTHAATLGFGCSDDPSCQYYTGYVGTQVISSGRVSGAIYGGQPLQIEDTKVSTLAPSIYLRTYSTDLASGLILSSAWLTGSVNFGTLKGSLAAESLSGSEEVDSMAGAATRLMWGDTFILVSDNLEDGTEVPVEVQVDLDRAVGASELPYGTALAYADLRLTSDTFAGTQIAPYVFDSTAAKSSELTSIIYNLPIGKPIQIEGQLEMQVFSQSFNGGGRKLAYVDAGHTAHYYLNPLLAGVTYSTASGRTYLAPPPTDETESVPEPSTWAGALLVGGFLFRKIKEKATA